MTIRLTDEVEEYLTKRHKDSVEVYVHRLYYGKGGPMSHVEATMGVPLSTNLDHFKLFDVDGFKVYVENPLVDDHDIMIKLDKMLGIKHLEVERD